jgi:curved DNA-binding protein
VVFEGGGGDVGDFFASLFGDAARRGGASFDFGGFGGRARPRQSRGNDALGTVEIPFGDAALGTRRTVRTGSGTAVEVSIPPGVESGGRLRIPGAGGPAPDRGGAPGDLYLDVRVLADKRLRRSGADIEMDLPISVAEAALGAKVEVPTVEGPVTVTVPPGTGSGARLRLRGRGIKRGDGTRGDQLCRVEIVVPKGIPDNQELRKLFEEIGRLTESLPVREF